MPADLDALIAEAEGLCAAMPKERWVVAKRNKTTVIYEDGIVCDTSHPTVAKLAGYDKSLDRPAEQRAAFIARARTLIPELLAALRQRPGREDTRPNPARVTPLAEFEAEFLRGEVKRLAEALAASEASRARLAKVVTNLQSLMADSTGVDGLHLNGDVATWRELCDGQFDMWLGSINALLPADLETPHG